MESLWELFTRLNKVAQPCKAVHVGVENIRHEMPTFPLIAPCMMHIGSQLVSNSFDYLGTPFQCVHHFGNKVRHIVRAFLIVVATSIITVHEASDATNPRSKPAIRHAVRV